LPGFTFKDCLPVTGNGLRKAVRWKKADVARLAGKEVVVAVEFLSPDGQYPDVDSPRLYAIYTA
jgi:hypothetical protein